MDRIMSNDSGTSRAKASHGGWALLFAVALSALALTAMADGSRNRYYFAIDYNANGGWKCYNENWESVSAHAVEADKGCDVTIAYAINDNRDLFYYFDVYSLTLARTNTSTAAIAGPWCDGDGKFTIREGGLVAEAKNAIRFSNWSDTVRVKLAESQTWRGPTTGTTYGEVDIGSDNTWSGNYYHYARITALKDLTWTLDGRMMVCLTASNDLSNVDIVVNPKARLLLQAGVSDRAYTPFLNAKSLTLKGGDTETSIPMLTLAKTNPTSKFSTSAYAPATFDDATFSPKVFLVDGASVVNGGTVDYGVSELSVSGGDSTFSGMVIFKKMVSIDIASGASLAFTGKVAADEGAGIDLSGGGSLMFTKNLIMVPVCGDGTIRCDPGADGETVLSGDLSSFTGTIYVASGELLIHPDATVNPAATITTAEGASCRNMSAADFGDYTIDGKSYYRSPDGAAHQYLYQNVPTYSGNASSIKSARFREVPDVEQDKTWVDGSVFVVDRYFSGGFNSCAAEMAGIIVDSTATFSGGNFFGGADTLVIGDRGIEFRRTGCTLEFYKGLRYFQLSGSQTWKGPAAETLSSSPARINVGGSWNYQYPSGSVTALEDLDLTLEGDLNTFFYYPTNDMTKINLIVKKPAKVSLSCPGNSGAYIDLPASEKWIGRINAKSLTFDGGVNLAIDYLPERVPVMTAERLSRKIILKNGATFGATVANLSGRSWTGVTFAAGAGNGEMTGTFVILDDVLNLEAEAGATLDVTGATFKQANGVSAAFALTGPGTIRFSMANLDHMSGGVAVNGATLELTGNVGTWTNSLASAGRLSVATSGSIYVTPSALSGYAAPEIAVTSGTLVLDSVAALPQGCKVVTSGTGALMLVDPTGFDADTHMGGTQNLAADVSLIVTDVAREGETLEVQAGQALRVFGSGLKASSTVSLAAGSFIVFHNAATISAPVTIVGSATIMTDNAEAEGIFTGKVTVDSTGSCEIDALGGIVFEGGLAVSNGRSVNHRRGVVTFRNTDSTMNGTYRMYAGHCIITNCKVSSARYDGSSCYWLLDQAEQTDDVLLEIAKGGTMTLGNNAFPLIGRSNLHESRLLINGGTMSHGTWDTIKINDNTDGTGNGIFEFASGSLVSQRRIIVGHKPETSGGSAKFIWRGGTWSGSGYRYGHLFEGKSSECGIDFIIAGTNCVLDLGGFNLADSLTNFYNGVSRMIGMAGAKLKIKGKGGVASKFTLANFTPNGMALDLNPAPACDVDIVGDGNDIELGWTVPGTGGVVRCIGTVSPLLIDYVVPGGEMFVNSQVNDSWHSGFASAVAHDLVFWDGSTYLLRPTGQGLGTLNFSGAVRTSGTVRYDVDKSGGTLPEGEGITIVSAAEGCEGDGTWSAANGTLGRKSRIYGGDEALLLDHKPVPMQLHIR